MKFDTNLSKNMDLMSVYLLFGELLMKLDIQEKSSREEHWKLAIKILSDSTMICSLYPSNGNMKI